jgi:hypothetical protein
VVHGMVRAWKHPAVKAIVGMGVLRCIRHELGVSVI